MLEKSYSRSAYAISVVAAAIVLLLFALSYGNASFAYAADATAADTAASGKLIAGERGAATVATSAISGNERGAAIVATSATSGNKKLMTLENAKGTIHLYPIIYNKAYKTVYLPYDLYSSSDTRDEPTNVTSSNKKVCEADPGYGCLELTVNWTGKSVVSYTWRGKVHRVTFVVHKWTKPMKSLVVGGKQYAGKFKKSHAATVNTKYFTGKVKVKSANGWKVRNIEAVKGNYDSKMIKLGKTTIKKSDKIRGLTIRFVNKVTGQEMWVDLNGKGFVIPF